MAEDWKVSDNYDYGAARQLAKLMDPDDTEGLQAQIDVLQKSRAATAAAETQSLQSLADQLGVADENTNNAIAHAKAELAALTNPNGPQIVLVDDGTLAPGGVRNLGPVPVPVPVPAPTAIPAPPTSGKSSNSRTGHKSPSSVTPTLGTSKTGGTPRDRPQELILLTRYKMSAVV